jgi:hypothetical protein
MSINQHIISLQAKHTALDNQLATEQARPLPDDDAIRNLKHEKLALKDEIQRKSVT